MYSGISSKSSVQIFCFELSLVQIKVGAQWLSGRVLDSRPRGRELKPHRRHCVMSLSKNINPSLVLVQPRKNRPFIIERLLMGRKESNQKKQKKGANLQIIYNKVKIISKQNICSKCLKETSH